MYANSVPSLCRHCLVLEKRALYQGNCQEMICQRGRKFIANCIICHIFCGNRDTYSRSLSLSMACRSGQKNLDHLGVEMPMAAAFGPSTMSVVAIIQRLLCFPVRRCMGYRGEGRPGPPFACLPWRETESSCSRSGMLKPEASMSTLPRYRWAPLRCWWNHHRALPVWTFTGDAPETGEFDKSRPVVW